MRKTSDILWQDAQHQVLFEILDLISEPGADRQVFKKLKDYAENHFYLEECYMEALDYPGFAEHKAAHNGFRQEVEGLLTADAMVDDQYMDLIGTYLTEWLTRHVFGTDKKLEGFILQSGTK